MSQAKPDTQWPPRSPHEVLLSTPGGRDRLRRLAERASPSPSPSKRPNSNASFRNRAKELLKADMDMDDGDEEDEETLQLQLQEIQARLKLKKLQKRSKQSSDTEVTHATGSGTAGISNSTAPSRAQSRMAEARDQKLGRSQSQNHINVPVSPVRRTRPVEEQRSPGRILLGIDKGLKGHDISLKRAPSLRKREETTFKERLQGPFLQRPNSQVGSRGTTPSLSTPTEDRPQSFSERMSAVRTQETEKRERDIRISKVRSKAFDIDHEQMESFKKTAVEMPDILQPAPAFSRDEVMNSYNKPSGNLTRSKTTSSLRSARRTPSSSATITTNRPESQTSDMAPPKRAAASRSKKKVEPSEMSESEATQFDPYSSAHLSKRIIPHQVLTRNLAGKKPFLVPDLLRVVKSPDFSLPDIEEDVVLFGIIAKKSDPQAHAANGKRQTGGKYMIIGLTDLKWELDLFLFGSAFDKFWKMTPGTIIAVLNPGIMPPKVADTGKFSLVLNSDEDTIMEVGTARDLGFCKSVKRDGKTCESWIDKRHTEFCDYHVNEALKKTRSSRMEVNSMTFGKGYKHNSRDMTGHFERKQKMEEESKKPAPAVYDKESHSHIYIGKKSSASLLDDVDFDPDAFHRGSTKEERVNRRVLAQEKERNLARKLGSLGAGIGADYMRHKDSSSSSNPNPESSQSQRELTPPPPDAASLGLLSGKAGDVALSPIKRKRAREGSGAVAMGWGSELSKKLGGMRDGERFGALQPVKKKTRFVTERGIKVAGRESFGGVVVSVGDEDDDDDDGLDIVRY